MSRCCAAKQDAGADFAVTQFFFDAADYFRLRDRAAAAGVSDPDHPRHHAGDERGADRTIRAVVRCRIPRGSRPPVPSGGARPTKSVSDLGVSVATAMCQQLLAARRPGCTSTLSTDRPRRARSTRRWGCISVCPLGVSRAEVPRRGRNGAPDLTDCGMNLDGFGRDAAPPRSCSWRSSACVWPVGSGSPASCFIWLWDSCWLSIHPRSVRRRRPGHGPGLRGPDHHPGRGWFHHPGQGPTSGAVAGDPARDGGGGGQHRIVVAGRWSCSWTWRCARRC